MAITPGVRNAVRKALNRAGKPMGSTAVGAKNITNAVKKLAKKKGMSSASEAKKFKAFMAKELAKTKKAATKKWRAQAKKGK